MFPRLCLHSCAAHPNFNISPCLSVLVQDIFNFLFSRLLCGSDYVRRFKTQIKMWLGPPATFRHCPFHIIQKCTTPIKTELHVVSHASIAFLNKRLCGLKVELLLLLGVILCAVLWDVISLCGWDECLGLFLSLLILWQTKWPVQWCSQNEWSASVFPWQPPTHRLL